MVVNAAAAQIPQSLGVADVAAPVKPRLRGIFHLIAYFVSLVTGVLLVLVARTGEALFAAIVYASSISTMFGASALYHVVTWRDRARRVMRRIDHSAIFLLIAGTYTPVALLVLDGAWSTTLMIAAWGGAVGGIATQVLWVNAPRWVNVGIYLALGWMIVVSLPLLIGALGWLSLLPMAGGGALYSIGAVIYGRERPNPSPAVFGYHEIFHLFVIAAVVCHYLFMLLWVLPTELRS